MTEARKTHPNKRKLYFALPIGTGGHKKHWRIDPDAQKERFQAPYEAGEGITMETGMILVFKAALRAPDLYEHLYQSGAGQSFTHSASHDIQAERIRAAIRLTMRKDLVLGGNCTMQDPCGDCPDCSLFGITLGRYGQRLQITNVSAVGQSFAPASYGEFGAADAFRSQEEMQKPTSEVVGMLRLRSNDALEVAHLFATLRKLDRDDLLGTELKVTPILMTSGNRDGYYRALYALMEWPNPVHEIPYSLQGRGLEDFIEEWGRRSYLHPCYGEEAEFTEASIMI